MSSDGYSVVKLNQTGPHYFIRRIIEINDKIIIQVIADKRLITPTSTSDANSTSDATSTCKRLITPTSNEFAVDPTTCNQWDERSRSQFGDIIVFTYEAEKSLVFKIKQEDHIICSAPSPVDAMSSYGYSVVKLNQTGPYYFISRIIEINDKIIIQVIADKRLITPTTTISIYVLSGLIFIVFFSVSFVMLSLLEENLQTVIRFAKYVLLGLVISWVMDRFAMDVLLDLIGWVMDSLMEKDPIKLKPT